MNLQTRVREHFDRDAPRFDAIYAKEKSLRERIVDHWYRGVVLERFRLVCNLAPAPPGWSLLDVGTGSGRYPIALARQGAKRTVGVDLSPKMIELATREAMAAGVGDRCRFEVGEFLSFKAEERFDLVLAMGYFDYLDQPLPHLERIRDLANGKIVASFPKRWEWRAPARKVRFMMGGGFVRFYSRGEVQALLKKAGLAGDQSSLIDLGRDWILVSRVAGQQTTTTNGVG
jgi:SAM-dependent methyltransferase